MSRQPIRIRVAHTEADLDVCRTLQRVTLPHDELIDPRPRPSIVSEWLVARTPRGVGVGFSGGYRHRTDAEDGFVITRQGVIPIYRGLRLQQRMIRETMARARRAGIAEVWTYTTAGNIASANSFIACGFRLWTPTHWNERTTTLEPAIPTKLVYSPTFLYWRRKL